MFDKLKRLKQAFKKRNSIKKNGARPRRGSRGGPDISHPVRVSLDPADGKAGDLFTSELRATGPPMDKSGAFRWYQACGSQFGDLPGLHGPRFRPSLDQVGCRISTQWIPDDPGMVPSSFGERGPLQLDPAVAKRATELARAVAEGRPATFRVFLRVGDAARIGTPRELLPEHTAGEAAELRVSCDGVWVGPIGMSQSKGFRFPLSRCKVILAIADPRLAVFQTDTGGSSGGRAVGSAQTKAADAKTVDDETATESSKDAGKGAGNESDEKRAVSAEAEAKDGADAKNESLVRDDVVAKGESIVKDEAVIKEDTDVKNNDNEEAVVGASESDARMGSDAETKAQSSNDGAACSDGGDETPPQRVLLWFHTDGADRDVATLLIRRLGGQADAQPNEYKGVSAPPAVNFDPALHRRVVVRTSPFGMRVARIWIESEQQFNLRVNDVGGPAADAGIAIGESLIMIDGTLAARDDTWAQAWRGAPMPFEIVLQKASAAPARPPPRPPVPPKPAMSASEPAGSASREQNRDGREVAQKTAAAGGAAAPDPPADSTNDYDAEELPPTLDFGVKASDSQMAGSAVTTSSDRPDDAPAPGTSDPPPRPVGGAPSKPSEETKTETKADRQQTQKQPPADSGTAVNGANSTPPEPSSMESFLQRQLKLEVSERERIAQAAGQLEAKNKTVSLELRRANAECEDLRAQVKHLQSVVHAGEERLRRAIPEAQRAAKEQASEDMDTLRKTLRSVNALLAERNTTETRLKGELDDAAAKVSNKDSEIKLMKAEMEALRGEVFTMEQLRKNHATATEKLDRSIEAEAGLRSELATVRAQYEETKAANGRLSIRARERDLLERERDKLKLEARELTKVVRQQREQIKDIEHLCAILKQSKDALENQALREAPRPRRRVTAWDEDMAEAAGLEEGDEGTQGGANFQPAETPRATVAGESAAAADDGRSEADDDGGRADEKSSVATSKTSAEGSSGAAAPGISKRPSPPTETNPSALQKPRMPVEEPAADILPPPQRDAPQAAVAKMIGAMTNDYDALAKRHEQLEAEAKRLRADKVASDAALATLRGEADAAVASAREENKRVERELRARVTEVTTERNRFKQKSKSLANTVRGLMRDAKSGGGGPDATALYEQKIASLTKENKAAMQALETYKRAFEVQLRSRASGGRVASGIEVSELQRLANGLSETINDKDEVIVHMRRANKLLGARIQELERQVRILEEVADREAKQEDDDTPSEGASAGAPSGEAPVLSL